LTPNSSIVACPSRTARPFLKTPFMPKNEAFAKEKGTAYGTSADNFVGNGPFVISGIFRHKRCSN
jgi:ABC-type oligopeptide transport system substrate-binding subunit